MRNTTDCPKTRCVKGVTRAACITSRSASIINLSLPPKHFD